MLDFRKILEDNEREFARDNAGVITFDGVKPINLPSLTQKIVDVSRMMGKHRTTGQYVVMHPDHVKLFNEYINGGNKNND